VTAGRRDSSSSSFGAPTVIYRGLDVGQLESSCSFRRSAAPWAADSLQALQAIYREGHPIRSSDGQAPYSKPMTVGLLSSSWRRACGAKRTRSSSRFRRGMPYPEGLLDQRNVRSGSVDTLLRHASPTDGADFLSRSLTAGLTTLLLQRLHARLPRRHLEADGTAWQGKVAGNGSASGAARPDPASRFPWSSCSWSSGSRHFALRGQSAACSMKKKPAARTGGLQVACHRDREERNTGWQDMHQQ
jgi:hypothetical protein